MPSAANRHCRGSARHPRCAGRDSRAGFSLLEALLAIMLLTLVSAIGLPALADTRVRASVHNSKHAVLSSIALARTAAIRFGRPAVLRLDSRSDRVWVEVDTTLAGGGAKDTLNLIHLGQELSVDLTSNRTGICFNGRGIGTTGSDCPSAGGVIILSMGGRADTVFIGPLGRVVTR